MLANKTERETPSCNKENDILRAAEREFLAKGFSGARTVSIAQAAGVTHAMLHYYFRTKEQLFERILDENGKIDPVKLEPITFDPVNNAYLKLGEKVGNAFKDGMQLK